MGFELPNGKTARNIQEQVKFLTEKIKELIARVNELELHIEIVDELPETGSSDIIYFVPVEDPEEGNYYNEYMWIDDAWELIGTTQIDLSGYAQLSADNTFTGDNKFTTDVEAPALVHNSGALWLGAASGVQVGSHLFPGAVGALDLGHSYYTWKDLYLSGKAIFSAGNNTFTMGGNEYNGLDIARSGTTVMSFGGSDFSTYTHQPFSNNTYDLGSSSRAWRNLYLSGNLSDGTNTVSVAAISKTRLYLHRFQFTYTGGGGYLNVITNSATGISDTESNFQTAINSAVSVYVNQSDGSRALFLSASLSQNDCRWFTSSGTATGGSVSFGSESIAEIQ